jgi:hypothetical protein
MTILVLFKDYLRAILALFSTISGLFKTILGQFGDILGLTISGQVWDILGQY